MARKFNDFIKEAERRESRSGISRQPFEIELPSGKIISVPYPDAQTTLRLSSIPEGETMRVLAALFADRHTDFNHLVSELKDQPVEVIQVLTEEMYDFWNSDVLKVPGKSKG